MGRKRIGVAHLLQPCSVRLCALFHRVAAGDESGDAGEEFVAGPGMDEVWRCAAARGLGTQLRDLMAAHGDPEAETVFGVQDQEFELEAEGWIEQESLWGVYPVAARYLQTVSDLPSMAMVTVAYIPLMLGFFFYALPRDWRTIGWSRWPTQKSSTTKKSA